MKGTIERVWTNEYNQETNTKIMILNIFSIPKVPCALLESIRYSHFQLLANISTFCHYSFIFLEFYSIESLTVYLFCLASFSA